MSDAFLGDWKLTQSENFDELMKKLGVGLVTRKIANSTKPSLRFGKNGDEWTLTTISSVKTHAVKFKFNEEFNEETIDGRKVKSVVVRDGDKMVHTQRDKENKVICVITREVANGELRTVRER